MASICSFNFNRYSLLTLKKPIFREASYILYAAMF